MAKIAYKNIGVGREGSALGTSAVINRYLQIKSLDLRPNENKVILDDTSNNALGGAKYYRERVTLEGSMTAYATPSNIQETLEMVCGTSNAGTSVGASALSYTYVVNQNAYMSKWFRVDDGVNIEDYHGLRAKTWKLDVSDMAEISVDLIGQGYTSAGSSMASTINTQAPFSLAELKVWVASAPAGLGGSSMSELVVHDFGVEYDNQMEGKHESGKRTINRADPKIPTLKVTFKRFYEDTILRDNNYLGSSTFAMRIEAFGTDHQSLIAGVTPYVFRIDIPSIQVTENHKRNYEAGEMIIEDITMEAVFNSTSGYLWQPYVINEK